MRRTRQREAILEALRSAARPLGPDEIAARAGEQVEKLNLATVYRNLKWMAGAKQVVAVECVGQAPRYEIAGLEHHHHFLCEVCDRLFDLPGCLAEELDRHVPDGFEVSQHHIQLAGRCGDCAS